MPTFQTPGPISVTMELGIGDVVVSAGERTDTVVELRPSNPSSKSDVQAAERSTAEFANGVLLIKTPKPRPLDFSSKRRSVDVSIELPAGSTVSGDASIADLRSTGRLGEVRFKSSIGRFQLDHTGPLRVNTSGGNITVERAEGKAEITTGTGSIRVGEIEGPAVVKNSNGRTEIGLVTGEVQVRAANGDITVERALGRRVDAKTANGSIVIGEVARGSVVLKTATGDIEVGIGGGVAAWLDLHTSAGRVTNSLADAAGGPANPDQAVEVRVNTSFGDITIRRS
ncbi:MAG: DUF4097 family beta strand repeat-containing protein [Kibdelosporangium sp.]